MGDRRQRSRTSGLTAPSTQLAGTSIRAGRVWPDPRVSTAFRARSEAPTAQPLPPSGLCNTCSGACVSPVFQRPCGTERPDGVVPRFTRRRDGSSFGHPDCKGSKGRARCGPLDENRRWTAPAGAPGEDRGNRYRGGRGRGCSVAPRTCRTRATMGRGPAPSLDAGARIRQECSRERVREFGGGRRAPAASERRGHASGA